MKKVVDIPWSEFEFQAVRSGGPGGQHVNKTASAVLLYWDVVNSNALPIEDKNKILTRLRNKINSEGTLMIRSESSRDQSTNKKECVEKLYQLLETALTDPKPRKKTRPTRGSVRRRLSGKAIDSDKKKMRREKF